MDDPAQAPGHERRRESARLARPPGARYAGGRGADGAPGAPPPGDQSPRSVVHTLVAAILVGAIGALVIFGLGLLDVGAGLIAVAAGVGWAVTLALLWGGGSTVFPTRGTRTATAATLAGASVVAGFLIDWGWARVEGGVLDPIAYFDQRYGPLALLVIAAAAVAAALRAR